MAARSPEHRQAETAADPDRSMANFIWCMTAIDWGWSNEETVRKLPEVSKKTMQRVQHEDDGYPLITAQNAATEVETNDRKREELISYQSHNPV